MVGDHLACTADLGPQPVNLGQFLWENVVKRHDASRRDERRVHLEVLSDAAVAVVAVDEQQIDRGALERLLQPRERSGVMRIAPDQRHTLTFSSETGDRLDAAAVAARRQVDRDYQRVRGGEPRPRPQCSTPPRTDLDNDARLLLFHDVGEQGELAQLLFSAAPLRSRGHKCRPDTALEDGDREPSTPHTRQSSQETTGQSRGALETLSTTSREFGASNPKPSE